MPVPDDEVEQRFSAFSAALRNSGLRLTHQRLEVAREIARSDTHPDVEAIYEAVRQRIPSISLDTVYRTMATLNELGLVRRVSPLGGAVRYDANLARHHHFVCTRCGLIRDVASRRLDAIEAPEQTPAWGRVESVEVQFRGVCEQCQRKEKLS